MPSNLPGFTKLRDRAGHHIRRARKERGLTQEQLAEAAGIERSYVAQIETRRLNISLEVLERLADALSVDGVELLQPIPDRAS
jgi:transcriptional regulator with XRE-family HTH domain